MPKMKRAGMEKKRVTKEDDEWNRTWKEEEDVEGVDGNGTRMENKTGIERGDRDGKRTGIERGRR